MRFPPIRHLITAAVLFAGALVVGCGGSDSATGTNTQPASVEGYWVVTAMNNAGSALLTGCTGDFASLNGLTIAAILGTATCTTDAPQYTSQSGTSFTHGSVGYSCDNGDWGTRAGGGTVNGNSVKGQMDTLSGYYGFVGSDYIKGTKTGSSTLSISEYKTTSTGAVVGSCNISPALSMSVTIYDTAPMAERSAATIAHYFGSGDVIRYIRSANRRP